MTKGTTWMQDDRELWDDPTSQSEKRSGWVELTFAGGASIGKYLSEASGVSFPTDYRLFAMRRELIG